MTIPAFFYIAHHTQFDLLPFMAISFGALLSAIIVHELLHLFAAITAGVRLRDVKLKLALPSIVDFVYNYRKGTPEPWNREMWVAASPYLFHAMIAATAEGIAQRLLQSSPGLGLFLSAFAIVNAQRSRSFR